MSNPLIDIEKDRFVMPTTVTIFTIQQVKSELDPYLGSATLTLDFSATEKLDGAGVQWLMALKTELKRTSGQLKLIGITEHLQDIFALFGDPLGLNESEMERTP